MAEPMFPGNTKLNTPKAPPEKPKLKPVTSGHATRKKKSLGKQFSETFLGGDLRTTARYVIVDVAIPSFKDLIADSAIQGVERLIFGESRNHRRRMGPIRPGPPGPQPGRVQYQNYSAGDVRDQPQLPQRQRSRAVPTVTDFDDFVLDYRSEAETVLERMGDVLEATGAVTVADFYSLVNLTPNHTDYNWGWTDLKGSSVTKNRGGGYLINLPDPSTFQ